ncbi:Abi-alpha family protein [Antrihabitans stalactiti]|uniref:DUF4393 domain-containing protein n=1 Tax=Antrihabitans stalactiti TaxID=2584121 RepID=A0A848K8I1_9NOCA|nr:Abi-alpha family protein [Antrihabitans stalactiti]NMN93708.1 DUF4393 domain-containing protein [Antrihabitans stalactiti]
MTEKSGPHELRRLPVIAVADGLLGLVGSALRRPLALTESILRQLIREDSERPKFDIYPGATEHVDESFTAPPDPRTSVRSMVQEMLERSVRQSPAQAETANYKRLLLALVPDEVRIINALADGRPRPIIHVGIGSPGSVDRRLLNYATTIGTDAGIRLPRAVTSYVQHLETLGLVDIGPEDDSLREQYEILETYEEIEAADKSATADSIIGKLKMKSEKHIKRSITLSELGRALWNAADPDTYDYQVPDQRDEPTPDHR